MKRSSLVVLLGLLVACGGGPGGGTPAADGGAVDGGGVFDGGSALDGGAPDGGGSADGGSVDGGSVDGGTPDGGSPAGLSVERFGARVVAPPMAFTRLGRELWIGTRAVLEQLPGTVRHRAHLVRLDLDSGAARRFEEELPHSTDPEGLPVPASTAGAVRYQDRTIVAAYEGLLVVRGDAVTLHPLRLATGETAHPNVVALAPEGDGTRLWVGTNRGLFALAPDTLEPLRHLGAAQLEAEQVVGLAADPGTGAVYPVVVREDGSTLAARVQGEDVRLWKPALEEGVVVRVVWSARHESALFALRSWDAATGGIVFWDGTTVRTLLSEGQLAQAARGEAGPFGTTVLALDESTGILVVGGQLRSNGILGGFQGGGVVWVDLTSPEPALVGLAGMKSGLRGDHITALAYDPETHRTFVALRTPCHEFSLGNLGLDVIRFVGGVARFERPLLSGVRDLSVRGGEVRLALRDDRPGVACEDLGAQTGLVALRAGGIGELLPLAAARGARGEDPRAFQPGTFAASVLSPASPGEDLAAAGTGMALFVGSDAGTIFNPTSFGVSLLPTALGWESGGSLWLASRALHRGDDRPERADLGLRGAVRLTFDTSGAVSTYTHYSRLADPQKPEQVGGLPSSDVRAVLPIAGGGAYVVCGLERMSPPPYDRFDGEPFALDGGLRPGGVARVTAAGEVEILAGGADVPDGRAAALDANGVLHVLDAQRGLLRVADGGATPVALPAAVPAGSTPTSLWLGAGGDLAATFSTGVAVRLAGVSAFLSGFGWAWKAAPRSPGVLLVGTDQGLLRVRAPGVPDVQEAPPPQGERPPFASLR